MKIVIFGLSLTSFWGNSHSQTYRCLLRELTGRGHEVDFIERALPWYPKTQNTAEVAGVRLSLYGGLDELPRFAEKVAGADVVIVGSFVPDGVEVGEWVLQRATGVTAFYDLDTPMTLAKLRQGNAGYVSAELIKRYHLYLSATGGPALRELENEWGSPMARPLYRAVDPAAYYPEGYRPEWDLGYLGIYSMDRQPGLKRLLLDPAARLGARRFVVAGSQYPEDISWPANVERIENLPAAGHRRFYNRQRFTLNLTRADMIAAGYSPSARLFEAAACGTPIISDEWPGVEAFFEPDKEILIARSDLDVQRLLWSLSDADAARIGQAARKRVLAHHTAAHRATQLEDYIADVARGPARTRVIDFEDTAPEAIAASA